MKLKIKKLSAVENPVVASASKESYECGSIPTKDESLFVDYEIGIADHLPEEGKSFKMLRTERNGVSVLGIFQTSIVTKTEYNRFHTTNSIYQWEEVE